MSRTYDFVAIGGGSAGFNAARVAAGLGQKAAVVDGARQLSGLCILKGCMPSKTLIYAAEVLHLAKTGSSFGLSIPRTSADPKALHARKTRIIGAFTDDRVKALHSGKFDLLRSNGHFVDAHTLELADGRRIKSKAFLIGTGSRVSVPDLPGLRDVPSWTSDEVLDLDFIPKSVIVLGGGIVATELAQYLNRTGTKVTLIQRAPQILKGHSEAAAGVVTQAFRDEGIEVHTGTKITGIRRHRGGVMVAFETGGKTVRRHAAHLFNALGREPNTKGLGLDAAGIKTGERGNILINRWQQSNVPNIYAAGDCSGPHEIVHVAIQQGELAARHAAGVKGLKPVDESLLLSVVFTDPQLATIGWPEKHLQEKGIDYLSASYPFNDHGKSILMNANYGFVKVLADRPTGRILGAEIVGKDAGELIHAFTTPLAMRATVHDMLRAPWYHPTLSEIVTYPLEEIADKLAAGKKPTTRALRH